MLLGVPANPMPQTRADAIGQAVAQVPGIVEAYLPLCYIKGDDEPRQVLVIGVQSEERIPAIMQDLMSKMDSVMPADQFIDILPFSTAHILPEARVEECRILGEAQEIKPQEPQPKRPWWRLW